MTRRNAFLMGGVISTLGAWGCFQLMEYEPDFSPASETLNVSGYLLVALALILFFIGFTSRK